MRSFTHNLRIALETAFYKVCDLALDVFDSDTLDPEPVGHADLGDCALPDVFRPGRGKT